MPKQTLLKFAVRARATARQTALAACLAAPFVMPAMAASPGPGACASPAEEAALAVRTLQSRLMVAALVCDARTDYNAFVLKYRPTLQRHHAQLTRFFARHYGSRAKSRQNNFFTQTANEASQLSIRNRNQFCDQARRVFTALGGLERGSVEEAARLEVSVTPYQANVCPSMARR